MIKVYTAINANSSLLTRLVRIREHKIASYLRMKKDDHLLVSSVFWAQIRPETFSKLGPNATLKPGPTFNSGVD